MVEFYDAARGFFLASLDLGQIAGRDAAHLRGKGG